MSARLQIGLLGHFRVLREGELVTRVMTTRIQSLIAYLIMRRAAPQPRAHVAFMFWPDSEEKQALTNLRHLLHELRHALPEFEAAIAVDARTLRWRSDTPFTVDVVGFDTASKQAEESMSRGDASAAKAASEAAAQLYAGDFMAGCYEEWIEPERGRLRRSACAILERLTQLHEDAREYDPAIHYSHRLCQLEPTRETAVGALMRLQLLKGDRAAALQTYQSCVALLQRDLNVGPSQALRDLRQRALADISPTAGPARSSSGHVSPEYALRGRQPEWRSLLAAWKEAAAGRAAMVAVSGVAGIGKSRLAEELCGWVERQGGTVARTRSFAAEGRLAYAPAAQWLRSPALCADVRALDPVWRAELVRLVPDWPTEPKPLRQPSSVHDDLQRQRLFEALSRAFARPRPLLLLLDDIQWTDRETLEWLRYLMRGAPAAPLLLLATVRAEELTSHGPLPALLRDLRRDDQLTEIALSPLSADDAAAVAADVAGRPWSPEEAARLFSETEGNPLFVVESVRAGWRGSGTDHAGQTQLRPGSGNSTAPLPPKVHAVILTRLSQLSPLAREVAGVAAVIGRSFTFEILAAAGSPSEDELVMALEELWQRRILHEQTDGRYDFTHDKLREVAYGEIIGARRRLLHRRIAEALERIHAQTPDAVRAQVAAHLESSGDIPAAIAAYHDAAEAAKRSHASDEAIRLFQKSLSLLQWVPDDPARARRELGTSTALGVCLVAAQGYPASEVWGLYERARELCRQLGRPTEPPILRAIAIASLTRGELQAAHALGVELLEHFARVGDQVVYVEGHYVLGVTYFWLGKFADSRRHLETALAGYDPGSRGTHLSLYAQDPKAVCLCRLGWTLWHLGFPDQAIARVDEALAWAREVQHPHTEGYVLFFGAQVFLDARQAGRAGELLAALDQLTQRHPLHFTAARGRILSTFVRANPAPGKEAQAQCRAAIEALLKEGHYVQCAQFLGHLAELQLRNLNLPAAEGCIAEAHRVLQKIEERYHVAEVHRLEGELLRAGGGPHEATEACFRKALEVSRLQADKSLELRAAVSLGRFWHSHGRVAPAREVVQGAYAPFSEGYQTMDLVEARALLARCE